MIDLYTKIVLTVIAVSLFWHALGSVDLVSAAHADPVQQYRVDVNIAEVGGLKLLPRTALPVEIDSILRQGGLSASPRP
jgi:hypothetical protein